MDSDLKSALFYFVLFIIFCFAAWYYILYTGQTNMCFKEATKTICAKNNMSFEYYSYWKFEGSCKEYLADGFYHQTYLDFKNQTKSLCQS